MNLLRSVWNAWYKYIYTHTWVWWMRQIIMNTTSSCAMDPKLSKDVRILKGIKFLLLIGTLQGTNISLTSRHFWVDDSIFPFWWGIWTKNSRVFRYQEFHLPFRKLTWQWKMYLLLEMVSFHCHVSFRGCTSLGILINTPFGPSLAGSWWKFS